MSCETVARKPLIVAAPAADRHLSLLSWAITHRPTREAYRLSTGEDAGSVLDRYQAWLAENIIGSGEDLDC